MSPNHEHHDYDIPSKCRADTIHLSNEFTFVGVPLETCELIFDSGILHFINTRWANSNTEKTASNIWSKKDKRLILDLIRL